MKPILYSPKTTNFNNNGIGILADALICEIIEERNGIFELCAQYPETGVFYSEIITDSIIKAPVGQGRETQCFRVFSVTTPINGVATIKAEHISYQLCYIPISPFTAGSAIEALAGLKTNAAENCPFNFWTDKTTAASFTVAQPCSIRSRLGGNTGSILDVYGGEYEFDNFSVKLYNARGADNGVKIAYGKNITDLEQENAIDSLLTGVYPYWKSEEKLIGLPEKVISTSAAQLFSFPRTLPLDLSAEFETEPTAMQLREKAESYIKTNKIDTPRVSIAVDFLQIAETPELAALEKLNLCDTVNVQFLRLGINVKAKIIKTVFNVLLNRFTKLEIGEARASMASAMAAQQEKILAKTITNSVLAAAISSATAAITGQSGGYVVLNPPRNPQEILIMDTNNINTAANIWRWNGGGLGFSKNGYNGPFETAITKSGEIVADFITTGKLTANLICGGILQDLSGKNSLNMDNGEAKFNGKFTTDSLSIKSENGIKRAALYSSDIEKAVFSIYSPNGNSIFDVFEDEKGNAFLMLKDASSNCKISMNIFSKESSNLPVLTITKNNYGMILKYDEIEGSVIQMSNQGASSIINVDKNGRICIDGKKILTEA